MCNDCCYKSHPKLQSFVEPINPSPLSPAVVLMALIILHS